MTFLPEISRTVPTVPAPSSFTFVPTTISALAIVCPDGFGPLLPFFLFGAFERMALLSRWFLASFSRARRSSLSLRRASRVRSRSAFACLMSAMVRSIAAFDESRIFRASARASSMMSRRLLRSCSASSEYCASICSSFFSFWRMAVRLFSQ